MPALAFLVVVGMALVADGLHFDDERGLIHAAMVFTGSVEGLNPWRRRERLAAAERVRE